MRYLLILVALLAGCSDKAVKPIKALAISEPAAKSYSLPNGSLTTIQVPVITMGDVRESQTCFLWRDSEYKTATLQCPNDRQTYTIDP